jgi:hypothetical protein
MLVYNPTAQTQNEPRQLTHKMEHLASTVIGFIDNTKPNFNHLVDELEHVLKDKFGVRTVVKRAKRGPSMPAPQAVIAELAQQCDLVITGSGD